MYLDVDQYHFDILRHDIGPVKTWWLSAHGDGMKKNRCCFPLLIFAGGLFCHLKNVENMKDNFLDPSYRLEHSKKTKSTFKTTKQLLCFFPGFSL